METDNQQLSPELLRYLALCERAFVRMVAEGRWPWADSPDFEDMVESNDNPQNV
jgi:hypothetical protein